MAGYRIKFKMCIINQSFEKEHRQLLVNKTKFNRYVRYELLCSTVSGTHHFMWIR